MPVVRETGGLKDTIYPYNQYTGIGNGFGFRNYNANELMGTIEYAISIYNNNKDAWKEIVRQAMESNNSWDRSANEYKHLYESLLDSN